MTKCRGGWWGNGRLVEVNRLQGFRPDRGVVYKHASILMFPRPWLSLDIHQALQAVCKLSTMRIFFVDK